MKLCITLKFIRPRLRVRGKLNDYTMNMEESTPPMISLNFVMNVALSMK
jgi:hypothetical protein